MKKLIFALVVVIVVAMLSGANIGPGIQKSAAPLVAAKIQKKPCYGYTIIEFGKGINCQGDTVKLVKVRGGQQLAIDLDRAAAFDPNNLAAE